MQSPGMSGLFDCSLPPVRKKRSLVYWVVLLWKLLLHFFCFHVSSEKGREGRQGASASSGL